ncbi:hypothetical protein L4C32_15780 [Aliivibrio kagoshimensis]
MWVLFITCLTAFFIYWFRAQHNKRRNHQIEICFIGFDTEAEKELTEQATSKGMVVRECVNDNLHILCYGSNPKPEVLEHARTHELMILNQDELSILLKTGGATVII